MKNNQNKNNWPILKVAVLWTALAVSLSVNAQVRIDWQQCYGSLGPDYGFSILPSNESFSVLGQVEEDSPSGLYECNNYAPYRADWLIGVDGEQALNWQNCFTIGLYQKMFKTGNDIYYISGLGLDNNYNYNLRVIQTDGYGNRIWTRYLGTDQGLDYCADNVFGLSTSDDGIIVATTINEASGDANQHFGNNDCWVVKLDAQGNIEWQTTLGTEGNENITCLQDASDGGVLLWINSDQTGSGNLGCGQPENKGVLVKLDAVGQFQWNLCFERTSVNSIVELEDGYLFAGDYRYTVDPYGNCGDGIYTFDCYLFRCDTEGNVVWDKEFGGSCNDKMKKVFHTGSDNGFTAFANSKSTDGDVKSCVNLGVTGDDEGNVWVFHVDADGNLLWESCIGSQLGLMEEMRDVVALSDKEYTIVGFNTWFDGVSSGLVECSNNLLLPNSGSNIWVLQVTDIYDYDAILEVSIDDEITLSPNPTTGQVNVQGKNIITAEMFNTLGQHVATVMGKGEWLTLDLSRLPSGVYFVKTTDEEGRKRVRTVLKE
ncbi:MAG: T9SS type A sorting domain-containing protein [Bacteroidales bacterium]|nr:T9SS type A sorting domain-containing protein [Bacteroidales bacterium]